MRPVLVLGSLTFLLGACRGMPTLQSIRYGYQPDGITAEQEATTANQQNDVAAGWAPEPAGSRPAPVMYGRDGSPVGTAQPGSVTTTSGAINDGVAAEGAQGGSRSMLLDLYGDAVEERDELLRANEDLQAALDLAEQRANLLSTELESLKGKFDTLGTEKQSADAQLFDMAARLATAQMARLEAERALLEATIEWRRISEQNNEPLGAESDAP